MNLAELIERTKFHYGLHLAFEQHWQNTDAERSGLPKAGADLDVLLGHTGKEDSLLLMCALSNQTMANGELLRKVGSIGARVSGCQLKDGLLFGRIRDIESALLCGDQWCQFGKQELRNGDEVSLPLHHAGEPGDV